MAKLTAHGNEIGTIEYLTYRVRYMTDGQILKNCGNGWKLHKRVKDGINPKAVFENHRGKYQEKLSARPLYTEFMRALHDASGLYGRSFLVSAIQLMPDDPDGVWSTFDDSYDYKLPKLTIDECVELCKLYKLTMAERIIVD
jgi:hypothetical protein